MKLVTLRDSCRDGHLVVISRNLSRRLPATGIAVNLRAALDHDLIFPPWLAAIAAETQGVGN